MNATNRLSALPEFREELDDLLAVHSPPIVSYCTAIYAELFDGLPFNTELNALGICLLSVFEKLASPLE
ncbi:MAG: hypothetical protein BRD48_03375 [Bacteroidetes bacterium QS_9_68_14]|nr:MAG: hypothetical protein BRD48_03375 [Bacteroidetes bacterium QS_9_68_14]